MPLTIGQIGAGRVAPAHLRAFVRHPQVNRVHVADPSRAAREELERQFGIIRETCEDYRRLLDDPAIDLVDICTPHHLHATQAIEALQAGKHVIVETPPALTVTECDAMVRVARETGRYLFCTLSQRKFPAHCKAEELLREGAIGDPFLATITVLMDDYALLNDPDTWQGVWEQAGGGALFGAGYHAVYMLQHLFGPAHAVSATLKRLRVEPSHKAEDSGVIALELPRGVLAAIVLTAVATGDRPTQERRLVGARGSLLVRDDPEDEMPLVVFHEGDILPVRVHNPPHVMQYAIREAVTEFLDCVVAERESELSFEEARAAVATVAAAYESEQEGRRVQV